MDSYMLSVLSNIGMISFLALSAYLLLLVGKVSFGQQAYFAISAYVSAMATTLWGCPLWLALFFGAISAGISATLVSIPTLRLKGFYFSVATLAFAEMIRLGLVIFKYQVEIDGELVGPEGSIGFRGIRYIYDHNFSSVEYLCLIYGCLLVVIGLMIFWEHSRIGSIIRMTGADELLTEMQGINVKLVKVLTAGFAGTIAGLGGGLYAHYLTYVGPEMFGAMLGVHAVSYGLIGGLGTTFGPLLGTLLDFVFLKSAVFSEYRMIIFGGIVAVLLIFKPRGLLDEALLYKIRQKLRKPSWK